VAAANDAEQGVTTAQAEHVSRSTRVGMLLLKAKKLHPAVKAFEAFLKQVNGLKLSRAYGLLRLAGGRTGGVSAFCNVEIFRSRGETGLKSIRLPSDIQFAMWLLDSLADFVFTERYAHLIGCAGAAE
jgi:hypothetical protein